jgi:Zn-dependent protease
MGQNLFIQNLKDDPPYFFAVCITVVVSICLHELSHGLAAIYLGDRTPVLSGHMTLNPARHMGGLSLIMLMIAGIAWGAMPINPVNLRGRYGRAWVALAGPACNVLLALLALSALALRLRNAIATGQAMHMEGGSIWYFLIIFGNTNIALAIFNLLPIPPLDGSKVLADFSPPYARILQSMRSGATGILFLVAFFCAGNIIFPAADHICGLYLRWAAGL